MSVRYMWIILVMASAWSVQSSEHISLMGKTIFIVLASLFSLGAWWAEEHCKDINKED